MTATCPNCGSPVAAGARFCPQCGTGMAPPASRFCASCGQALAPTAAFCASCGQPATGAAGQPPSYQPPQQGPVPEAALVSPLAKAAAMGFWIRVLALLIDWGVLFIVYGILSAVAFPVIFPLLVESQLGFGLFLLVWIAIPWLYFWLLTGVVGQTVGKWVVGIKVIRTDGARVGLGSAFLREVIGKFISGIVILLGYLWVAFDGNKQGWHDKMARTYVVATGAGAPGKPAQPKGSRIALGLVALVALWVLYGAVVLPAATSSLGPIMAELGIEMP